MTKLEIEKIVEEKIQKTLFDIPALKGYFVEKQERDQTLKLKALGKEMVGMPTEKRAEILRDMPPGDRENLFKLLRVPQMVEVIRDLPQKLQATCLQAISNGTQRQHVRVWLQPLVPYVSVRIANPKTTRVVIEAIETNDPVYVHQRVKVADGLTIHDGDTRFISAEMLDTWRKLNPHLDHAIKSGVLKVELLDEAGSRARMLAEVFGG